MSWVSHNQGQSSRYNTRITEGVCVCVGGGYALILSFHREYDDTRN